MSAAVPVVSMLSIVFEDTWIRFCIAILGAIVTISVGIMSLYQYRKNWIEYRSTAESLKHEKFMFKTKTGVYSQIAAFPVFVEKIEALISRENTDWKRHLKTQKKNG